MCLNFALSERQYSLRQMFDAINCVQSLPTSTDLFRSVASIYAHLSGASFLCALEAYLVNLVTLKTIYLFICSDILGELWLSRKS